MPPSPKNSAWMSSATLTERHAAYGPNRIAISVPPTAWPVVPPGSGTLNIMPRNDNAAAMPKSGSFSCGTWRRTFATATNQTGAIAAPSTAHVDGLR